METQSNNQAGSLDAERQAAHEALIRSGGFGPNRKKRRDDRRPRPRMKKPRHNIVTRGAKDEAELYSDKTRPGEVRKPRLKFIPLGGLGEIGKNMAVLEYDDPQAPNGGDIIILDMGFGFPASDMFGVNYILPDISYLEDKKDKIRGILITHGHEDHIGGVPHLLPHLNAPIFGTRLTIGFIEKKLEEYPVLASAKMIVFRPSETLYLGVFKIEPFRVTHSVMDSVGFAIHTPFGLVVTTGDFKLDPEPVDGRPTELEKLERICNEAGGALMLMSDSTNVEYTDRHIPEKELGDSFNTVFETAKGRIIIGSFASQVSRMQQAVWAAEKYNRRIILSGRGMQERFEVAMRLGYIKTQSHDLIVPIHDLKKYPDERIVILSTGSQGEEFSALARLSRGEHAQITVKSTDTIMLSSSPIPGNEEPIIRMLDDLMRQGAHVIYDRTMKVHTSGHAFQAELAQMINVVKPRYFVPIHGEYHHLILHRELGARSGIPFDNIFIMENGNVVEGDERGFSMAERKVSSGIVIVDGAGVGDIGNIVIRDRQAMAQSGIFVVIVVLDKKTGQLLSSPDIISRGFVYMREAEELIGGARIEVKKVITQYAQRNERNWKVVKEVLKEKMGDFLYQNTKREPMVIPVIIEV